MNKFNIKNALELEKLEKIIESMSYKVGDEKSKK